MNKKMQKAVKYSNEPMRAKGVDDFLPPPERLVVKDDTVKVTLFLSKESVAFFKQEAAKHKIPYQKMIRSLIDHYVQHYNG